MNDAPLSKAFRYKCSNSFEISASNLIRLSERVTVVIPALSPFRETEQFLSIEIPYTAPVDFLGHSQEYQHRDMLQWSDFANHCLLCKHLYFPTE